MEKPEHYEAERIRLGQLQQTATRHEKTEEVVMECPRADVCMHAHSKQTIRKT